MRFGDHGPEDRKLLESQEALLKKYGLGASEEKQLFELKGVEVPELVVEESVEGEAPTPLSLTDVAEMSVAVLKDGEHELLAQSREMIDQYLEVVEQRSVVFTDPVDVGGLKNAVDQQRIIHSQVQEALTRSFPEFEWKQRFAFEAGIQTLTAPFPEWLARHRFAQEFVSTFFADHSDEFADAQEVRVLVPVGGQGGSNHEDDRGVPSEVTLFMSAGNAIENRDDETAKEFLREAFPTFDEALLQEVVEAMESLIVPAQALERKVHLAETMRDEGIDDLEQRSARLKEDVALLEQLDEPADPYLYEVWTAALAAGSDASQYYALRILLSQVYLSQRMNELGLVSYANYGNLERAQLEKMIAGMDEWLVEMEKNRQYINSNEASFTRLYNELSDLLYLKQLESGQSDS